MNVPTDDLSFLKIIYKIGSVILIFSSLGKCELFNAIFVIVRTIVEIFIVQFLTSIVSLVDSTNWKILESFAVLSEMFFSFAVITTFVCQVKLLKDMFKKMKGVDEELNTIGRLFTVNVLNKHWKLSIVITVLIFYVIFRLVLLQLMLKHDIQFIVDMIWTLYAVQVIILGTFVTEFYYYLYRRYNQLMEVVSELLATRRTSQMRNVVCTIRKVQNIYGNMYYIVNDSNQIFGKYLLHLFAKTTLGILLLVEEIVGRGYSDFTNLILLVCSHAAAPVSIDIIV